MYRENLREKYKIETKVLALPLEYSVHVMKRSQFFFYKYLFVYLLLFL